jgi:hypothetical protein
MISPFLPAAAQARWVYRRLEHRVGDGTTADNGTTAMSAGMSVLSLLPVWPRPQFPR